MSSPRHAGKVIVLNGTSSSGKTSIATELQRAAPDLQLLHVQLDAFRAMEPTDYWSPKYQEQAALRQEALCRGLHGTAAHFARYGQNVLLDHVLTPSACKYLVEDLAGVEVVLIKVVCNPHTLEVREALRGDRPIGLAKSQLHSVHACCIYDFEVDTSAEHPTQCAQRILGWLQGSRAVSAFHRMQRSNAT